MILGKTGSGKSTLADFLLQRYLSEYPKSKVLIIDSKPRFKAQWEVTGVSAAPRYRKWSRGMFLEGSFRVPQDQPIIQGLDSIWQYRGRIAIAQTTPGQPIQLKWLEEVARVFYGRYSDKEPRLIYVDELSDFFEVQKMGGIFWQAARSGRELNIALMAGSQRPSYIPKVVLTESDRIYLFALDYDEDIKSIKQMGIPKDTILPQVKHSFFYWDKTRRDVRPSGQYYTLEI